MGFIDCACLIDIFVCFETSTLVRTRKMAAFESSAESKIIPISTKIAELKKRITLAGGAFY